MSKLFRNPGYDSRTERQVLESKYNTARTNLLVIILFTAINMVTLATNLGTYFLFSANIPYMITFYGAFLCGMFPKEYYVEAELEGMFFFDQSFFVVMLMIAILILALYLICWLFSKNGKVLWLKIGLGLFIADTVLMIILGSAGSLLLDAAFHIWVIVILVSGINAHKKLKDMPKDSVIIEAEYTEVPDSEASAEKVANDFVAEAQIEAPADDGVKENTDENAEN